MARLSRLFRSRSKAAIQAKRDKFVDDLHDVYNELLFTTDPYIDPKSYETFKITCHHLYLYHGRESREQANFERYFSPMSVNQLQSYPIDKDDENTVEYLELEQTLWKKHKILGDKPMDAALEMCHIGAYRLDTKPHVMFSLVHEYASDDNKLLRGEVLAILATMLTRLTSNEYQDHNVIPVLVLSFMGDKQARLLQAYFGDQGLVIYKSRLLSFQVLEDAEKSIEFLLQFMAGKLVGSTAVTGSFF
ncbi:uncharacterized protein CDV56_100528 [Aspergillus thermomutatus]|uniref:Uncharacterized protein n=1 Tax=Aspergillus thermomutatus TaxID=41047 RepID=A0A397G0Z8_ASPTH|nr:uncharacterized protein CDV56_100528 [Aspergillus thermomutatus]RHZ43228.1 hypothetical protein CDV56_100528 [Aspergillus thermomutatus]